MYVVITFLFQLIFVLSIFTIIVIALSSGCLHADIYSKGASHDKRSRITWGHSPGNLEIKHLLSESWLFIIVMVIIIAIVIFIIIITGIIIINIIIIITIIIIIIIIVTNFCRDLFYYFGSSKFSITLFVRFLYPTPLFSFFSHSLFKPQIPIT